MALAWQAYPGDRTGPPGGVSLTRRRGDPGGGRRLRPAELLEANRELEDAQRHAALMLARVAESKDPATGSHIERIYGYTLCLARSMGLEEERALEIAAASMLHDVGKLAVPNRILQKPGPLTPEEWRVIQQHPLEGVQILGSSPLFSVARDIVRWHHERWDGSGYPDGLRGNEIPVHAAIVAVADVYDALTSRRAYKAAWETEEAVAELRSMAGVLLYPDAVAALVDLWRKGVLGPVRPVEALRAG